MPSPLAPPRPRIQCRCLWDGERCPNQATQEDGLCDWCEPSHPVRVFDLVVSDAAFDADAKAQRHRNDTRTPGTCSAPGSGRTLVDDRRAS